LSVPRFRDRPSPESADCGEELVEAAVGAHGSYRDIAEADRFVDPGKVGSGITVVLTVLEYLK
jgi:hypothetical protein